MPLCEIEMCIRDSSENLASFGDFQKIKVEELEQYAISKLVQNLIKY